MSKITKLSTILIIGLLSHEVYNSDLMQDSGSPAKWVKDVVNMKRSSVSRKKMNRATHSVIKSSVKRVVVSKKRVNDSIPKNYKKIAQKTTFNKVGSISPRDIITDVKRRIKKIITCDYDMGICKARIQINKVTYGYKGK